MTATRADVQTKLAAAVAAITAAQTEVAQLIDPPTPTLKADFTIVSK